MDDQVATPDEPRVGALLRLAHERVESAVYQQTAAAGHQKLRPAHFRLLRFPGLDGVRPTHLAARVNCTKQAINPLLNDLEAWGYLRRESDPDDGRGRVLYSTDMGRALMAIIATEHQNIEKDVARRVGTGPFKTAIAVLREIKDL
jgi:DNA-binding MarR family transcriptional regulator